MVVELDWTIVFIPDLLVLWFGAGKVWVFLIGEKKS